MATVKAAEAELLEASTAVTLWAPAGTDGTRKVQEKLPWESVVRPPVVHVEIGTVPNDRAIAESATKPAPLAVTGE